MEVTTAIAHKRWIRKEADPAKVSSLQSALGIHPKLCELLVNRGIETFEQARQFFRPSLEQLHDPFLMKDMHQAINRIDAAIVAGEKILVYGDYDVDGTTSVALVYSFLKDFYPHVDFYVPNRYTEGYGISVSGVEWASQQEVSLIIALDCGITAVEQVAMAKDKGIDFIICDHHLPGEQRPNAVAILDPKQPECKYPYDELSGCGIGFKLLQALSQHFSIPVKKVYEYLDLVAVSIASDIVPLTGENRVLAFHGLKKLNENPLPGFKALLSVSGLQQKQLVITDILFGLGPRINAAGRMDDARHAVRLLIADVETPVRDKATILDDHNKERREKDENTTLEALALLEAAPADVSATVVFQPHWHKGVIGIVASRLIETYYRPTIVFTQSGDMLSGSARSIPGYNIYNAIDACSDLVEQFGGHKYAAGLAIRLDNYERFKERFQQHVADTIPEELLIPVVTVDAELELKHINPSLYRIVKQFGPFGPQNMRPVFMSSKVEAEGRVVGEDHLKLKLKQAGSRPIDGIAFGMSDRLDDITNGLMDVCYTVDVNEYRGYTSLQLVVKDIRA